ncbi:PREDICTED: kinesin-like protein unc-104 [Acropora digitifera]|nr:PREDICTED: kinesin-like protein unc-104 [Acropora digitifera]
MSSDRPDSALLADSGVISDGSTYSSRGSLGSISLSSSFLSLASLPAGKSRPCTTNADPEKARQNLLQVCVDLMTRKRNVRKIMSRTASSEAGKSHQYGNDGECYIEYYVPELHQIRKNPVISKKGYLHIMDDCTSRWAKCYVVVRKPYMLLYRQEGDPVEQFMINLKHSKVECPEYFGTFSVFSIHSKQCRFLVRTTTEKEQDAFDWLYALDPLLVGSIRSRKGIVKEGGR